MNRQLGNQIDLISIVKDVLKQWWVILLLAISASLFANIWVTANYTPVYTTKTTFIVTSKNINSSIYQNLSTARDLATRFAQVLDSTLLKKKVAEDLGLSSFSATTAVSQVEETNMVELQVSAGSPMEAYQVINSIMENYDQVSDYVVGDVILEVIQDPSIPMAPSNGLNTKKPMVRSFRIAAVIVMAYLVWMSYMRDTVKNESQLAAKVDTRSLGTIYRERKTMNLLAGKRKRSAISMLIQNPMRSFQFVESNKMVASRVRSHMDRNQFKVLLLTSVAENEGKSTVAANLALALALEGKRVLLADLDLRKPSQYKIFQLSREQRIDLPKALKWDLPAEDYGQRYKKTGLYTMFNSVAVSTTDALLGTPKLKEVLDAWRERVDYIILDTAPLALVSDTEDLVKLADGVVLVIREDAVLARSINDALDDLNSVGGKVLGCIFNYAIKRRSGAAGYYGYSGRYGGHYGTRKN